MYINKLNYVYIHIHICKKETDNKKNDIFKINTV